MLRPTEINRVLNESARRARVAHSSAASTAGPQAPGGIHVGEVVAGVFVPYGRVNITAVNDGFLPRRD